MLFSHRTSRSRHIIPLRRFLEGVFGQDLRSFFAESCFEVHTLHHSLYKYLHNNIIIIHSQMLFAYGDNVPLSCKQHYLQGSNQ